MKKIFAVVTLLALLLTMAGCRKEPEPIEKAQARAVEIGRQYLDFKITAAEAKEMLDSIKVPEVESGHGQLSLEVDIGYLSFLIIKWDSSYKDVEEQVEWVASRDYTK